MRTYCHTLCDARGWKRPIPAPYQTGNRIDPKGPVHVLTDGVWVKHPGPISLEQFYGRTTDPMAWQPRGNAWELPVSYWTRWERAERLRTRRAHAP